MSLHLGRCLLFYTRVGILCRNFDLTRNTIGDSTGGGVTRGEEHYVLEHICGGELTPDLDN